jgi:hypothetical protein
MASKYRQKCSTSVAIRKMQVKTILMIECLLCKCEAEFKPKTHQKRKKIILNSTTPKSEWIMKQITTNADEDVGKKGTLSHWLEYTLEQPLWKSV